jgi:Fe-Mn family superoxide dismutase
MTAKTTPFQLPPLPWSEGALDPVISARTIGLHYGKHHKAYVDKLNELVAGTPLAELPLEELVRKVAGDPDKKKVFNNAGQHWNHSFFWKCLAPKGGGSPTGELARRIDADLGGLDAFRKQFEETAVNTFGSGWAWLALKDGKLQVLLDLQCRHPDHRGRHPVAHHRRLGSTPTTSTTRIAGRSS